MKFVFWFFNLFLLLLSDEKNKIKIVFMYSNHRESGEDKQNEVGKSLYEWRRSY